MSASRARVSRSRSACTLASARVPSDHRRGRLAPPVQGLDQEVGDVHRGQAQEVRAVGRGQQQQPAGQPAHPEQLVHGHPGVLGDGLVGGGVAR